MANANPPQSIPLCFVLEYSWAMCLTHRFGTPEHSIQPQLLGVRIEILDRRVQPQLLGVWIKILDYRVQPQLLGVWIEILDRRVQPQLLGVWIEILDRRVQPQLLGVWIEILDRRVQLQLLGVWVVAVNFCRTMVVKPSHHRLVLPHRGELQRSEACVIGTLHVLCRAILHQPLTEREAPFFHRLMHRAPPKLLGLSN